jgi:hypothetical protein
VHWYQGCGSGFGAWIRIGSVFNGWVAGSNMDSYRRKTDPGSGSAKQNCIYFQTAITKKFKKHIFHLLYNIFLLSSKMIFFINSRFNEHYRSPPEYRFWIRTRFQMTIILKMLYPDPYIMYTYTLISTNNLFVYFQFQHARISSKKAYLNSLLGSLPRRSCEKVSRMHSQSCILLAKPSIFLPFNSKIYIFKKLHLRKYL